MRHFGHLPAATRHRLFEHQPAEFGRSGERGVLAAALGATLYLPADRVALGEAVVKQAARGVTSMVLCLEDSISDDAVARAEQHLVEELTALHGRLRAAPRTPVPLLFVRARTPEQVLDVTRRLGAAAELLSGVVAPKFDEVAGPAFVEATIRASESAGHRLYVMPVLESVELAYLDTRRATLEAIARVLAEHQDRVLAVRIGATDLCSAFALRRSASLTVYDVQVVASVIGDVVNFFGRAESGYTITGPVWEYFRPSDRLFKPQLRRTPFEAAPPSAGRLREELLARDLDGLIREVELDRANGLLGKTCIHPSHVAPVHALSVVSHEEYSDATDILRQRAAGGGVLRSAYTNKMNEAKPHRAWAEQTLRRAAAFGVARPEVGFVDLFAAFTATPEARASDIEPGEIRA